MKSQPFIKKDLHMVSMDPNEEDKKRWEKAASVLTDLVVQGKAEMRIFSAKSLDSCCVCSDET